MNPLYNPYALAQQLALAGLNWTVALALFPVVAVTKNLPKEPSP